MALLGAVQFVLLALCLSLNIIPLTILSLFIITKKSEAKTLKEWWESLDMPVIFESITLNISTFILTSLSASVGTFFLVNSLLLFIPQPEGYSLIADFNPIENLRIFGSAIGLYLSGIFITVIWVFTWVYFDKLIISIFILAFSVALDISTLSLYFVISWKAGLPFIFYVIWKLLALVAFVIIYKQNYVNEESSFGISSKFSKDTYVQ